MGASLFHMDPGRRSQGKMHTSDRLGIRSLKQWAATSLPSSNYLREVLLMEPDELNVEEYLAKIPIWLKLQKLDTRQ